MVVFQKIGIIGLGMLGGSIALDVRRLGIAGEIIGASRRASTLRKARENGFVDRTTTDVHNLIRSVDFLILATPPKVITSYLRILAETNPGLLTTDVASVKEEIIETVNKYFGKSHWFVGSHPIAGSEVQGLAGSKSSLFVSRAVVVSPARNSCPAAVEKVKEFWLALGARVIQMDAREHDYILAVSSHLPHLTVYALVDTLKTVKNPHLYQCLGSGFKDATRIGKSNPQLWAEIFLANRKHLLVHLASYKRRLQRLESLLRGTRRNLLTRYLKEIVVYRESLDGKK